jgi:hypothetical protein
MSKKILSLVLIAVVLGFFVVQNYAQEKEFKYIGSAKCKMCHSSKKSGSAYQIWESSAHSKAYQTLATDDAKAIGKKMGIEDPQKSDKCLICHVTGYGKPASMFEAGFSQEEGVGCEACHGPGSEYKSMKIMKELYAGTAKAADYGLVMPTEETCKTCHNEKSPTFKGFDFAKFSAKIAHPVPKE